MLYRECYISHATTVHRTRVLPAPGRLLRQIGDHVASDTVVAETDVPTGYHLIELDQVFGAQIQSVSDVLVKKVGDWVSKGEVIARTGRLFKQECLSPVYGQVLDARGARVLIESAPRHVELEAFYPGEIVNRVPGLGVTIEVTGAVVQGVWGSGQPVRGKLYAAIKDGEQALQADQVSGAYLAGILIGGRTLDREVIATAIRNQVRGIIVGSVESELVPMLQSSPLAVIVTEGLGDLPMARRTCELLTSYDGHEVCFSPTMQAEWGTYRPELVIPLSSTGRLSEPEHSVFLDIGTRVRALRPPHEGLQGEIVNLPEHRRRLGSGITTKTAEVDLESVGRVLLPLQNLEIIRS